MPKPLSEDLRKRVVATVESGTSRRATAHQFAMSVSCVVKLMQRWEQTGSVAPGQMGGWKPYALAAHEATVRALIAERADLTLEELREGLAELGIAVGRSSIGRFLKARKLTLKKSRSAPPSKAGRTWRRRAKSGASGSRP
jgi:transposase